tara:strand:+ start:5401 stop:5835 length:435 start_codon:yes stop_codon:yes gene_type:complete
MAFDQGNFDIFQELIEEINDLDGAIQSLATELATEIRENAPVAAVNGGSLKRSVKVLLDKYGFQIEMNDYGFFQNYGVGPQARTPFNQMPTGGEPEQPFGIKSPISLGDYEYKTRKFGLPARQFFNIQDIEDRLIETVLNNIEI